MLPLMPSVRFFYDLGSPYAYLTAERIDSVFGANTEVEWIPVLLGGIFKSNGRSSWAETAGRAAGIAEVEKRGAARGLPPFKWPGNWPNNGLTAMRVAVYAHEQDAGRRFAHEAFYEQFTLGNELSETTNIASAAERAGLDPEAALSAAADPRIKKILIENTGEAIELGVIGVPSVAIGTTVYWGDDRLGEAIADLK